MTPNGPLSIFWSFLFLIIVCFYLFRLVYQFRLVSVYPWIRQVDAEDEVGHGLMAIGMGIMLAPFGILSTTIIRWNIIVFALASLWFAFRLLTRRPLLVLLLGKTGGQTTVQSDAIHTLMHAGMSYMFLLMSSMVFSMSQPATYLICLFFIAFAFLTFFSGRDVSKDFQAVKKDWLQLGTNLAHLLMNGAMAWMFLKMISMVIIMGRL